MAGSTGARGVAATVVAGRNSTFGAGDDAGADAARGADAGGGGTVAVRTGGADGVTERAGAGAGVGVARGAVTGAAGAGRAGATCAAATCAAATCGTDGAARSAIRRLFLCLPLLAAGSFVATTRGAGIAVEATRTFTSPAGNCPICTAAARCPGVSIAMRSI
ncbi:MAG: hypothetical protein B7Z20_01905 [Sphingobium sp. 32-64-5]|nr:MAG: hypothetical protein B7Z20_01905 [Sphingobium sp. 32-64-5]